MIDIPPVVARKARAAGAVRWLDELEALIDAIASEWHISVGAPFGGGTDAYVARASTADGSPAVLKLMIPDDGVASGHEITALRLAAGTGCPQLYRADADRPAVLMERLGPPLSELGVSLRERHGILCDTARALWRPVADSGLPTGADKAAWLGATIEDRWERLGRPCSEAAVAQALRCAERRRLAHDDRRAVLVHGDVHQWNALRSSGGGYKLVDPDGLVAEPAYDLGVIMREDPMDLLVDSDPRHRARWLARRGGVDPVAVWEWGVIERVSTGLFATEVGLQPEGRRMLRAADHIATHRSRR